MRPRAHTVPWTHTPTPTRRSPCLHRCSMRFLHQPVWRFSADARMSSAMPGGKDPNSSGLSRKGRAVSAKQRAGADVEHPCRSGSTDGQECLNRRRTWCTARIVDEVSDLVQTLSVVRPWSWPTPYDEPLLLTKNAGPGSNNPSPTHPSPRPAWESDQHAPPLCPSARVSPRAVC